jgi:4-amino-4-deoxy-L-arabinose transferase-like glycosyltransferase
VSDIARGFSAWLMNSNRPWLFLMFLLILLFRLPHSTMAVIDWDEAAYFVVAQDIVNGGTIYQTSFENKGPVLYLLFVPIIRFFGASIFSLRLFTSLYLLFSMWVFYLICRKVYENHVALVPPLIYGLFFTTSNFGGLASNAELFMMLPVLLAMYYFTDYLFVGGQGYHSLFLYGLFSAAALMIKAIVLFPLAVFPLVLVLKRISSKRYRIGSLAAELAIIIAGAGVALLPVIVYLIHRNALVDCYQSYILFNYRNIGAASLQSAFRSTLLLFADAFKHDIPSLVALLGGMFVVFKRKNLGDRKELFRFLLIFTFASFLAVFSMRKMWSHYFLQMALPLSLWVGMALSQMEISTRDLKFVIGAVIISLNLSACQGLLHRGIDRGRLNDEYRVAEYISVNTRRNDRIFVLGGQPVVYFLSNLRAPSKYFWWYLHRNEYQSVLPIKDSTLSLFAANKPQYFIYAENRETDGVQYLEEFMLKHYHREKEIGRYAIYRINQDYGPNGKMGVQ